ncbi:hypothetical protein CBR_g17095 [Chara braunii]|uniref:Myb-like domain-containing protein n=1 Tax=Chara braunii TaxID=69332 RepID=A0A388KUL4_CHABU|nr:hypothetical protein CBR_g17095 [Chara braunii]|eukprot:GBG73755.1 hypothetical protein CBR_g17095 [Chara braunii]
MADVFRRLPLLVLVVLLLVLVVLFHVCVVGIVPQRRRRRRCAKKDVSMDGRQAVCRSAGGEGGGQRAGQSPSRGSRAVERSEYPHLPPHLQPLPDTSNEEEDNRRSRAVPLGSGSTQEWTSTELCGSREPSYGHGRLSSSTRTVLVDNRPDDDGAQVTAVARSSKSPASSVRVASGNNRDPRTQQYRASSASRGASARPSWMLSPSPLSGNSSAARNRGECGEHDCGIEERGDRRDGREVWEEQRRMLHPRRQESITRGVQRLRVVDDENDGDTPDVGGNDQDLNDDDCGGGEDDAGQVSPSKQSSMGGKGGRVKVSVRNGRRGKKAMGKGSVVEADGDAEGDRHFWSIDDMVALIRAKRDQGAHLQGMGTAYARMKPRELKWLDVEQRLKKVGVEREAERCGKKWDNLMQQFKKVHRFQGLSGKQDFFQFTGKERLSKGFSFNMDHTGAPGGVRLPSANSGDPESVGDRGAAVGLDDDGDGSTRGSSQTTGGPTGFGKRKSTRQQTFDALSECMEKHGALVVSTMESNSKRKCSIQIRQCEALEAEVEVQKKHYAASDKVSKLMCHALLEIAKAIREHVPSPSTPSSDCANVFPCAFVAFFAVIICVFDTDVPHSNLVAFVTICAVTLSKDFDVVLYSLIIATLLGGETGRHSSHHPCVSWRVCRAPWHPEVLDAGGLPGNRRSTRLSGIKGAATWRTNRESSSKGPLRYVESDFAESEEIPMKRKSSRRQTGALRIDDVGERHSAGGRGANEQDVNVAARLATGRAGGSAAMQQNRAPLPRVSEPPAAQEVFVRGRTPSTPRQTTATKVGVAAQGIGQGIASRSPAHDERGASTAVAARATEMAKAGAATAGGASQAAEGGRSVGAATVGASHAVEGARAGGGNAGEGSRAGAVAGVGEDDEALANRVRQRSAREGIDVASKLWVDDIHFWNGTEGNAIVKLIAYIEDRHEDDEQAAYQEASVQRLVGAFTSAVSTAEGVDGGRVSHERLKSVAEAMQVMLAATMWLMRMGGGDRRAHYNTWVFVQLTAKPTLIASMHRSFDARRHIVQAATAITDKLAKPPITLLAPPLYIPDWVSIGVKFLARRHFVFPNGGSKAPLVGHRATGRRR